MIMLVVGVDATGKTTFCNKLSEKTGFPVIHMSYPKSEQELNEMFDSYRALFVSSNNFIMDRTFYCEMVYGPVMRNITGISSEQRRALEEILVSKGCIIYYCHDTAENIVERFKTTGETHVKGIGQVQALLNGYERVLSTVLEIPVVSRPFGAEEA